MDGRTIRSYRPSKPELAVFVSGVASMGLEILAVRIVAPQFGSHIYTVGGILTVFLVALSLGYWQGGKRAATATNREMAWILLGTAVYVAVVVYASDLLLTYTSTLALPPRYASLPSVILLFGPPTYLLGFISPYAAELSAKVGTGEASGHVYALGTIGSIVGSAATTFVLIPALTVDRIGVLFGLALVATALAISLPRPSRRTLAAIGAVSVLLVAAVGGPAVYDYRGDVVHETETPYQHLEIVDDGDVRTMYLDGARHSAMDLNDPDRHVFTYTRYFHLPMLLADDPDDVDRVLFIGGGGYTGPQDFEERYDVTVDVVEIDPDVTDAASEYFGLEHETNDDLEVHTGDGRQYLQRTDETYDVIVLDAYKQEQVPFHLTTVEFMELVSDRLADDGIFHANVIASPSGAGSAFYRAQHKTMAEVFPETYAFRTSDTDAIQNVQLVATNGEGAVSTAELEQREQRRDLGVDLEDAVANRLPEPETADAPVLRDDRGGVEGLLDPMLGQRYVIEESSESGGPGEQRERIEPVRPGEPAVAAVPAEIERSSAAGDRA
ncbi:Spermine/spermidine synthase [Halobiforma haloterrestris]|uniref:Polyamine aminopropyltransferase n=1 Tax=Natronobacterium haloterrestre TaxID=148448 RepID=A0A1I1EN09_NATHA|nr:fused MFS/spermidine synthase [Halobiforma haloterrestris]SFB86300.1 Spermine/spermidine synthase [Halobiforma haloterrestris]